VKVPEHLNSLALEILLTELRSFGNKLNDDHVNALKKLLSSYTSMARGELMGRVAFPLGTGLGKTSSIRAWIIAAHQEGLLGSAVSLAVACSRIEALADLKRDLVRAGVPAEQVGLIHSYTYNPELARAVLAREEGAKLLPNHATEERTEDCSKCPIVLVSHSKVLNGHDRAAYETFQGKPRDLIIWDESLIATDSIAVTLAQLRRSKGYLPDLHVHPTGAVAEYWLANAIAQLEAEAAAQLAGAEPKVMMLTGVTPEMLEEFRSAVSMVEAELRKPRLLDPLRTVMDFSCTLARVCVKMGNGMNDNLTAAYGIRVPDHLNMVVLDASASIRMLQTMDPKLIVADVPTAAKRWDNVTIKHMRVPGGRTSIEGHFRKPRESRWIPKELARIIKGAPAYEGVVIFSFKHRGEKDVDVLGTLMSDLEHHGVDLGAKVKDAKGNEKDRVLTATWGMETGLNTFAHCKHVILLGVIRQDWKDLVASIIAQKRDLLVEVTTDEVAAVAATEVAHVVYQALSRGHARVVEGGQAGEMAGYIIEEDRQDRLKDDLDPVMPGATWADWGRPKEAGKLPGGRPAKVPALALKLKFELGDLIPRDVRDLRKMAPEVCEGVNGKTLQRALVELQEV
jgi:hypothetical protein